MKKMITVFLILSMLLSRAYTIAEAEPEEVSMELDGSPWVNSMLLGNLPEKAPAAVDDFYLSVNYDVLEAHQEENFLYISSHGGDQQAAVISLIHGESVTDPETEQLRIFFRQASDLESLEKDGTAAADKYVGMVRATANIRELNAVLLSDDFPFSPYIFFFVQPENLKGKNIVGIFPALSLSDNPLQGVESYARKANNPDDLEMITGSLDLSANAPGSLFLSGVEEDQLKPALLDFFNTEAEYAGLAGNTNLF